MRLLYGTPTITLFQVTPGRHAFTAKRPESIFRPNKMHTLLTSFSNAFLVRRIGCSSPRSRAPYVLTCLATALVGRDRHTRDSSEEKSGFVFILVMSDSITKLTQAIPLRRNTTLDEYVVFTVHWEFKYGPPNTLLSGNGPSSSITSSNTS